MDTPTLPTPLTPSLETPRLRLRPYHDTDLEFLHRLRADPRVWAFSTFQADPDRASAVLALEGLLAKGAQGRAAPGALFDQGGRFVGEAGAYGADRAHRRVNLGYNLLPEFWGLGYATEVTRALVAHFEASRAFGRVEATVLTDNGASIRVLEKAGFQAEAVLARYLVLDGRPRDLAYYRRP